MKLFEDSLMTLPIRILKFFSKDMKKYYAGGNNSSDAYEHFYSGFIGTLILADVQRHFKFAWVVVLALWFFHYVVKEIIVDGRKHLFKKNRTEADMRNFWCDTITRNAGFVFALPYLAMIMWRAHGL